MNQDEITPTALAQDAPVTPEPMSAADHAVTTADHAAFKEARRAERLGKPLAPVPATDPTPKADAAPVDRQISKRQQQINDYERRIAEQDQRIRSLESRSTPPPAPAPRETPPPEPVALPDVLKSYDEYLKAHPNAQYEDFTDARAEHRLEQKWSQREQAKQHDAQREALTRAQEEQTAQYLTRMEAHIKTDPEFLNALSTEVMEDLRPFSALRPGERPSAMNAIAEEVMASVYAPQFMRHFSDHPDELAQLRTLAPAPLLRAMAKLDARFESQATPPAQKPVTAMPRPTTLGTKAVDPSDPIDAAVASRDQSAFKAARLRERAASVR